MQPAAAIPVIEFRDVSYRVGGTDILSGFNLQVQSGETLVLLGRSGSGKTTSLKLVNRLLSPTSGEVRVKGVPNAEGDVIRLRRGIGYVIQDVGLFPHFTVERNIGLVPKIEGWTAERIRASRAGVAAAGGACAGDGVRVIRISCRAGRGSGWAWRGRWRRIRKSF